MAPQVYCSLKKEKPDVPQVHFADCQKHAGKVVGKLVPNITRQLIDSLYELYELIAEQSKTAT